MPADERGAWLAQACAADSSLGPSLRAEVESLLAHHTEAPLLAENVDMHIYATRSEEWPIGARIRVSGQMLSTYAEVPNRASKSATGDVVVARGLVPDAQGNLSGASGEHLIQVRKWRKLKDGR